MDEVRTLRDARKREVALGYRVFAALGWGDTGDGHISARDPDRQDCFWLLDVGVPFAEATPDALALIGPDGSLVEGGRGTHWPGYYIHWPILASRPDIVSAAHAHTPYGTPFAAEARTLAPITQEACIFYEDHALFDDEEVQVQSLACGERIAAALDRNRAVVLRNHGLLTVGATVPEAVAWFVLLERVAEAHLKAGAAKPISHNAALYAKADLATPEQAHDVFHHLVRRHVGGR